MSETKKSIATRSQKNTGMAIVAYIVFFVPLLTDEKDDPFVKFHVKQGLLLFILIAAGLFVEMIPILGWLLAIPLALFEFALFIIGVVNAANGKEKPLPLIGQFADKINI